MRKFLAAAACAVAVAASPAAAAPRYAGGYATTGSALIRYGIAGGTTTYFTNSACGYHADELVSFADAYATPNGTTSTVRIHCELNVWGGTTYATPPVTDSQVKPAAAEAHVHTPVPAGLRVVSICLYVDASWSGPAGVHDEHVAACQTRGAAFEVDQARVAVPLDPA